MNRMFIADAAIDPVTKSWIDLLGHLHPVVLHFPLGLLLVGAVAVIWNWFRGEEGVGEFAFHCIWIGAALAVLASVSGWFFAEHESDEKGLELHRWFAVGSTIAAVTLAALASLSRTDERPGLLAMTRILTLVTALGMAYTGHVGGEMVWGEGVVTSRLATAVKVSWTRVGEIREQRRQEEERERAAAASKPVATEPAKPTDAAKPASETPKAPEPAKPIEPAKPAEEPKPETKPEPTLGAVSGDAAEWSDPPKAPDAPAAPPAGSDKPAAGADKPKVPEPVMPKKPVSYKEDLLPLLKARCYECHSGEKPKDGVAFDHMDELIKTEGKRAVVMKGDPGKSTMFTVVMKGDDSKKRMPPPKKGKRLTPEEAGVIMAWIKEGAKLDS